MAVLIDTFRVCTDAKLSTNEAGLTSFKVLLAYSYGKRRDNDMRPTQYVDAVMKGVRCEVVAPYVLSGAKVHAVIKDVHIAEEFGGNPRRKMHGNIIDLSVVVPAPAKEEQVESNADQA